MQRAPRQRATNKAGRSSSSSSSTAVVAVVTVVAYMLVRGRVGSWNSSLQVGRELYTKTTLPELPPFVVGEEHARRRSVRHAHVRMLNV